ncbi:hypothetical protein CERSUDRAFT_101141 [Gelatoporia subvermispora B]|uniref:Uncharacterized protein n=1 Tax=Ceriporiopsis subvermispora (strain B) TaxID=914234 RepID=M2QXH5_CERS8|nr:hypothetical protein CERSUDRAFT_101141 [Gelatoporia subvermispora B]
MHARRSGPSTDSGYSRPRGDHSVDELLAHDAPLIGTLPRGRTALLRDASHTQYSPTAPCGILEETACATFTSSAHKTHHAPPPSRRPMRNGLNQPHIPAVGTCNVLRRRGPTRELDQAANYARSDAPTRDVTHRY